MIHQIERILDIKIRPALQQHGGNVEVIDVDNNRLFVRLLGGCQGCSSSKATVKNGIEQTIKNEFPSIIEVIDITDHTGGENPYM